MHEQREAQPSGKGAASAVVRRDERTRSLVFIALSIAIMAVSAWVVVPLGPIPLTLQMFAIAFAIVVLPPKQAIAAIAGYLLLGIVGVPVFSGMRGGLGVLLGPTGGYLMGYLPGVACGAGLLELFRRRGWENFFTCVLAAAVFTLISYAGGWAWYMHVAQVGPAASFAATVLPFIGPDLLKIVVATIVARAVLHAVPSRSRGVRR